MALGAGAAQEDAIADRHVSEATVDLSILSHNVGGDPARFQRLARLFIDSVSATLAELDKALADEDMATLADLGHRLKSSSRMVGALGFAAMCQRLEDMRDDATLLQARGVVDQMPGLLALVSAELAKGLA
jgi:HPt (histidine-containing phosphotransfer) domain-containing protein